MTSTTDTVFAGSIPAVYQQYMVPLIFEFYAADTARRLAERSPARVLEIAAGTGVVTRAIAEALPPGTEIVATDLNPAMLAQAASLPIARPVEWRPADAMQLPFDDASFDAVVCQFGAMFFPDKARAYAEARRVLRPEGAFLFNVWDRIEVNELADLVVKAATTLFPANPPRFMARTPHGYHDVRAIARDLGAGGFTAHPQIETVTARSRAPSARHAAIALCQGTPMRGEIEALDASRLGEVTDAAAAAIAARFGAGAIDAQMQAHVVIVAR